MGRQVNFFMLPEDIAEFERFVKTQSEVCFFEGRQNSEGIQVTDRLANSWPQTFIVQKHHFSEIKLQKVEPQNYWTVGFSQYLPALAFDNCSFDQEVLRRGRLYFQASYYTRDGWQNYPEDFTKWGDRLCRWLRKNLERDQRIPDYLGGHAKKWIASIVPVIECFEIRRHKRLVEKKEGRKING